MNNNEWIDLFDRLENAAWFFWCGLLFSNNIHSVIGYIAITLVVVFLGAKHIARRIEKKKNS